MSPSVHVMNAVLDAIGPEKETSTVKVAGDDVPVETHLKLLETISENAGATQRSISTELGVAVGLTNAYIKRAVRKGLVKIQEVPARRYAYYLTPAGFSEKSRLVSEYLASAFGFFRFARNQCEALMDHAETCGWKRLVVVGASELAEVAQLTSLGRNLQIVAVISSDAGKDQKLAGLPVRPDIPPQVDALIITDIKKPQETYNKLRQEWDEERILTLPLLRIDRRLNSAQNWGAD